MARNTSYMNSDGDWNNQQTLTINNPIYNNSAEKRKVRRKVEKMSKGALVVWLELSDNTDKFAWKLSPAFFKECGISRSTYNRALDELEAAGFINWTVKSNDGKNKLGYFNVCGKYIPEKETKAATTKECSSKKLSFDKLFDSKEVRVWIGPTGDEHRYTFSQLFAVRKSSISKEYNDMYYDSESDRTSAKQQAMVDLWYSLDVAK